MPSDSRVSFDPTTETKNRHGSDRAERRLRGRSVMNSFQNVKGIMPLSGFGFRNPGEPHAVEWALACSWQKCVQAASLEQNFQSECNDVDFGFL